MTLSKDNKSYQLVSRAGTKTLDEDEDQSVPFLSIADTAPAIDHEHDELAKNKLEKKFVNIEGMTCGACSAMIQKLLTGIKGVESSSVSLMLKRAEVIYNGEETSLDVIIEEIEDIGFDASELKLTTSNRNSMSIKLFYSVRTHNKLSVIEKLMGIEGVTDVRRSSSSSNALSSSSSLYGLPAVDMNSAFAAAFDSTSMLHTVVGDHVTVNVDEELPLNSKFYGTTLTTNNKSKQHIASICLSISYDPSMTGMRSIAEWINSPQNTDFRCKILFDSSDISQRKKNMQASRERELVQWTRLFKYSLLFAVPAFLATMVFPLYAGFARVFNTEIIHGCSIHDAALFLLATPIQFGPPGLLFYRGAWKSLRACSANMDVLVALATSIAYIFSVIQIVICVVEGNASPNTNFETSAVLITVIILGKYMETIAKGKTSQALDKLMDLAPSVARLVENWSDDTLSDEQQQQQKSLKIREIDARLIQLNDILEVPRAHKCPCDGMIVKGVSSLDESLITGESMAVHKQAGDQVIGATVNLSNTLYIRVNKIGSETVLSKIITLVENAQASRAPIQNLADVIASRFVPTVIVIAVLVFIGWFVAFQTKLIEIDTLFGMHGAEHGVHSSLYYSFLFSISVLVISCPCALGLATPTAVMVATGKAAELGILFKGGEPLEMSGQTDCIIFDKTGTLTQGKMQIVDVVRVHDKYLQRLLKMEERDDDDADDGNAPPPQSSSQEQEGDQLRAVRHTFWNYVYGAETQSEHLIATAVCNFIQGKAKSHLKDEERGFVDEMSASAYDREDTNHNNNRDDEEVKEAVMSEHGGGEFSRSISDFRSLRRVHIGAEFELKHWSPHKFVPHTGLGVTAMYKSAHNKRDVAVMVGNLKYMHQHRVSAKRFIKTIAEQEKQHGDGDDVEAEHSKTTTTTAAELDMDVEFDDEVKYEDKYLSLVRKRAKHSEQNGNTCVFVAVNGHLCAMLAIADRIKHDARSVIYELQQQQHIPCYMITGDNEITAMAVGHKIGIPKERIRANVSPADKQSIVRQLQSTRNVLKPWTSLGSPAAAATQSKPYVVTFVGDGINDSPSLAQADIGIAIGAGTDVAIASASVVLMNSKLSDVIDAIDVSRATLRRIKYNFAWALIYNLCMIPFAAGVFYPLIHYALPPYMAGLLMCLSSISVVCNSLLLKLFKPKYKQMDTSHPHDSRGGGTYQSEASMNERLMNSLNYTASYKSRMSPFNILK